MFNIENWTIFFMAKSHDRMILHKPFVHIYKSFKPSLDKTFCKENTKLC